MCRDCGCSPTSPTRGAAEKHPLSHHHHPDGHGPHDHHHHPGEEKATRTLSLHESVLERNDALAAANRRRFQERGTLTLNLMSSPGSGKTRLLERTLEDLQGHCRMAVIVGDVQTDNDAARLRGKGTPVVGIATGNMCHLDAGHIARAWEELSSADPDLLFIENVGNLVCPAAFDLGEEIRVVLLSVTEGEDKPLKYPEAFKSAHLVLLTKIDLGGAAEFDRALARANLHRVAPQAEILEISARTGIGLADWYRFLEHRIGHRREPVSESASV